MRAMLELACDEWRADQYRDDRWQEIEPGQCAGEETVGLGKRALDLVTVRQLWMRNAGRHAERLKACRDLDPRDDQDRGEYAKANRGDQRLTSMLPPDKPRHWASPFPLCARAGSRS